MKIEKEYNEFKKINKDFIKELTGKLENLTIEEYKKTKYLLETEQKEEKTYKQRCKKAKRNIKIILEIALEQDSENVNLIDRLNEIIKILDGKE